MTAYKDRQRREWWLRFAGAGLPPLRGEGRDRSEPGGVDVGKVECGYRPYCAYDAAVDQHTSGIRTSCASQISRSIARSAWSYPISLRLNWRRSRDGCGSFCRLRSKGGYTSLPVQAITIRLRLAIRGNSKMGWWRWVSSLTSR